ncbi:unnamed protein product [Chrysoparadoxa australica]
MSGNLLNQSMRVGYKREQARAAKRARPPTPSPAPAPDLIATRPTARYRDLGGIEAILKDVRELIEYPLLHPEIYEHMGIAPPRGILLHGPPGCGKTLLAHAIAGELGVAFIKISAPEVVSGMSGESEQKLRELFQLASESAPCIVFMDEVDAITPKRETSNRGMEKRIVAQLLTCLDSLAPENTGGRPVLVVGATNRPNDLDSALRRAGRFDREIMLGVPNEQARAHILQVMASKMKLSGEVDFGVIAKKTPGFVGADISSLTKEAAMVAINRIFSDLEEKSVAGDAGSKGAGVDAASASEDGNVPAPSPVSVTQDTTAPAGAVGAPHAPLPRDAFTPEQLAHLSVEMDDFLQAVTKVQPSAKREGFATVPDVSWQDVGALSQVREELCMAVVEPITHPERYAPLGLMIPTGVLLYGPPGCGKTLLCKAVANESGANFISVKGPELLDKYVGESERAVRQVFQRARASSPCIVFFDELDALCPKRGGGEGGGVSERVVNQLLTEMDGLEPRRNVFVVAATNRPELIDPAMLRPGRLDKLLYVPLPSPDDRVSILKALAKKITFAPGVDLEEIGRSPKADGFSGADLSALLREAGLDVLRKLKVREKAEGTGVYGGSEVLIRQINFEGAFRRTLPSVSHDDQCFYNSMQGRLHKARARSESMADKMDPSMPMP